MKTLIAALTALLLLGACGQKDALYAPGEGPKNTRYLIPGSDTPAAAPARPETRTPAKKPARQAQTAQPDADRHD